MALINEILVARFNNLLHKITGIKGPDPSPQLTPEISPSLTLENSPLDYQLPLGRKLAFGGVNRAAGAAGTFNQIQLRNPSGSGKLVNVEAIIVTLDVAGSIQVRQSSGSLVGNTTQKGFRDSRINWSNVVFQPTAFVEFQALAAIGGNIVLEHIGVIALSGLLIPLGIVLDPDGGSNGPLVGGTALLVASENAATQLGVNFIWSERDREQSEITG
jgi:hypothetical protein